MKKSQKAAAGPHGLQAQDLAQVRGGAIVAGGATPNDNGVLHMLVVGVPAPNDNGVIHLDK
jgi:hypothetical protein